MNNLNSFFRKLYSSPLLLWSAMAAVVFVCLGLAIVIMPSLTGSDTSLRYGLGGMIMIYGLYRFWTFYVRIKDQDHV